MTMANRLQSYLADNHTSYDMLQHDLSMTTREAALSWLRLDVSR